MVFYPADTKHTLLLRRIGAKQKIAPGDLYKNAPSSTQRRGRVEQFGSLRPFSWRFPFRSVAAVLASAVRRVSAVDLVQHGAVNLRPMVRRFFQAARRSPRICYGWPEGKCC